ncbi:MAG: CoA-binding protein [Candidatus Omnitrophica bacterium]|nr:CoA-binding protein [Candidatus Omnitrophota bacterium]
MREGILKKKIAVIGVSPRPEKFGHRIFSDLLKAGFDVEGIHPLGGEVSGRKIYRNLAELPQAPDLLITVVPHEATEKIVEEANRLGIKEIWMQPGSESDAAIENAKKYGISVVHDACFMVHEGLW